MGTPLDVIVDRALVVIGDYKLDKIAQVDPDAFRTILEGYMIRGVPKFEGCLKSLEYNYQQHCFYCDLDMYEIDIIASLLVLEWYDRYIQDILAFTEPLKDSDFSKYSTGQNLRPRHERSNELRRRVKQDITNYQLLHINELPYFGTQRSDSSYVY